MTEGSVLGKYDLKECKECSGKGRIIVGIKNKYKDPKYIVCGSCKGTGIVDVKKYEEKINEKTGK